MYSSDYAQYFDAFVLHEGMTPRGKKVRLIELPVTGSVTLMVKRNVGADKGWAYVMSTASGKSKEEMEKAFQNMLKGKTIY
jgi:hypothetical protein